MIDLAQYRHTLASLCRQYGVKRLQLVGSAARDDFDPEMSDIDLLLDFAGKERLFHRYFELKFALEEMFGRKVDLIQESAVRNPYLLAYLNEDRVTIYES